MNASVGVLALQGDFAEHLAVLERLGVAGFQVRNGEDLERSGALIVPGGESTTILKLIDRFDLRDLLTKRIEEGLPVYGTCAGAIVLASEVSDGEPPLGVMDISVRRNAYGRQTESFETDLEVKGIGGGPVYAVFIRAPVFETIGQDVEVLAEWDGRPVAVRQGNVFATAFHPELTGDLRMHEFFLRQICEVR